MLYMSNTLYTYTYNISTYTSNKYIKKTERRNTKQAKSSNPLQNKEYRRLSDLKSYGYNMFEVHTYSDMYTFTNIRSKTNNVVRT